MQLFQATLDFQSKSIMQQSLENYDDDNDRIIINGITMKLSAGILAKMFDMHNVKTTTQLMNTG